MKGQLVFILFALISALSCTQDKPAQSKALPRPNIIFIMADDHANAAISAYGSKLIQTPNIDRIAKEGILFQNSFVTNSICAPSRAVLLTGKYSHLNGLRDNDDKFDGSQVTFPKLLQQAGYYTALVGKWHLKTAPTGFDYWNILTGQGEYYNPRMVENGDTSVRTGYTTDIITDLALKSLDNRDKTKPFCLLYHHKAPHRNWMPDAKHMDMFKDDLPLPETFWDDYSNRSPAAKEADMRVANMYLSQDMKLMPEDFGGVDPGTGGGGIRKGNPIKWWEGSYLRMNQEQKDAWDAHYDKMRQEFREKNLQGKDHVEWMYQRYIKDYLRCIASVDDNIGRMLEYLDKNGLTENTLIVYTSDQGFYLGEHGWYDKRFMYEESLRMPLMMRYPAAIKAGQTTNAMTLNLDFAPTFLDFAGANVPADMQGQSLRPILEGQTPDDWRTAMYYQYYEYPHGWHDVKRHFGIRTERYKLIHFYNDIDAWELFDLQDDPHELNNLYDDPAYKDVVTDLKNQLNGLRKVLQVPED